MEDEGGECSIFDRVVFLHHPREAVVRHTCRRHGLAHLEKAWSGIPVGLEEDPFHHDEHHHVSYGDRQYNRELCVALGQQVLSSQSIVLAGGGGVVGGVDDLPDDLSKMPGPGLVS